MLTSFWNFAAVTDEVVFCCCCCCLGGSAPGPPWLCDLDAAPPLNPLIRLPWLLLLRLVCTSPPSTACTTTSIEKQQQLVLKRKERRRKTKNALILLLMHAKQNKQVYRIIECKYITVSVRVRTGTAAADEAAVAARDCPNWRNRSLDLEAILPTEPYISSSNSRSFFCRFSSCSFCCLSNAAALHTLTLTNFSLHRRHSRIFSWYSSNDCSALHLGQASLSSKAV